MVESRKHTGFTLIELLVVIAIIAILLSVLIPGLKRAKEITKQVVCASQLRQCGIAVKMYSEDNEEYLPDAHYLDKNGNDTIDMKNPNHHGYVVYRYEPGNPRVHYSNGPMKPFRFAYLFEGDYIETPEIFYCPGNRIDWMKYTSYCSPTPWGTLPQEINGDNQWLRIGYTYYPTDARPKLLSTDGVPEDKSLKFTRMNPSIPYTSDVIHRLGSLSHRRNVQIDENDVVVDGIFGLNALYIDGHVSYCNDQSVFWDTVNPVNGNNPWELIENIFELRDYDEVFFTVFRAIGP